MQCSLRVTKFGSSKQKSISSGFKWAERLSRTFFHLQKKKLNYSHKGTSPKSIFRSCIHLLESEFCLIYFSRSPRWRIAARRASSWGGEASPSVLQRGRGQTQSLQGKHTQQIPLLTSSVPPDQTWVKLYFFIKYFGSHSIDEFLLKFNDEKSCFSN